MCGIVAGLAFGKLNQRDESMRQKLLRYFTTELMIATEERGRDATGAAVLFSDGKYMGIKRGDKVTNFLSTFAETKEYYGSLLKVWKEHSRGAKVYLGHCRAGTGGDKEDNENNHPIKIGNLVGIHNGQIKNHNIIFDKLGCKRDGKVDSEAIFRLFDHYTENGKEPFTMEMLQSIVNRLDGQFAITLFNADNLDQIPVFRDGRPIDLVLIRKYGILLMVSELKFWDRVHFRYERMVNYNSDIHSTKMPSFLGKEDICTKKMDDDTAFIFDMSKKVTNETKITDLCEIKKMKRDAKIWKAKFIGYNSGYKPPIQNALDKTSNTKKRRVFDKITKTYVVKVGDKVVSDNKSTTLPVDKPDTNPNEEKKDEQISKALVTTDSGEKKDAFEKDEEKETKSGTKVELEDHTAYGSENAKHTQNSALVIVKKNKPGDNGEVTDVDEVIGVDSKDITVINNNESLIEVEMTKYSPEIIEAANVAYESLPREQKGCGDIEDLLDIVDIETEEKANRLGVGLVGNRAIKHGWLQGYMNALVSLAIPDDKTREREHHIAGLKSLVILLAKFYEKSKGQDTRFHELVNKRLAQIVLDSNKKIDITKLIKIFNQHEKQSLEEVSGIISQAVNVIKTN